MNAALEQHMELVECQNCKGEGTITVNRELGQTAEKCPHCSGNKQIPRVMAEYYRTFALSRELVELAAAFSVQRTEKTWVQWKVIRTFQLASDDPCRVLNLLKENEHKCNCRREHEL